MKLIEERYHNQVFDANGKPKDYETHMDYMWAWGAPFDYQNEPEMMEYVESHPEATLKDINHYFDLITPDGLPPGDDGKDLLEDGEDPATDFEIAMINELANRIADVEQTGLDDAVAFAVTCEDQGLQDVAMEYVTEHKRLTTQDLWHWLAKMTPDE
nr:MAG TPA: hypothetical protein [Caudoviricetes sp.]